MLNKIDIIIYLSAFFLFSLFISIGFYSYPQEDALILYRYVNNLASTGQISFNLGGVPSEGATDFFWLIILTFFALFRIDPYFSTIIISTICFYVITKIFQKEIASSTNLVILLLFVLLLLNMGQITGSSLYGFSTLVFCTLGLLVYKFAYNGRFILWSIFSVIFCLFRPEAVIFFLPSIYISLRKAFENSNLKLFFVALFFIISCGIFYLIWRYLYFETLLPLPLIVKQHGGELSINRYLSTISQFLSTLTIALILPILIYLFLQRKDFFNLKNLKFISLILITFSSLIYLLSLSSGYQSQNIFFRYFAPLYFIVFLFSMYSMSRISINKYLFSFLILILAIGSLDNSNMMNRLAGIEDRKISNPTTNIFREFSTKSFANHPLVAVANTLKAKHQNLTIMVTEAGVIPYATNFFTYDAVGLNTKEFAFKPVKCSDVRELKPDFIEIDVGPINQFFDFSAIENNEDLPNCGSFEKELLYADNLIVQSEKLIEIQDYNHYLKRELSHQNSSTHIAAQNILFCMKDDKNYEKVFINKRSDQIYFISKNDDINLSFLDSCKYDAKGYLYENGF
tara:strand:+ start:175 stop:1884 length:1710 start_codon:yes stop_codon:yes gene_type:complete